MTARTPGAQAYAMLRRRLALSVAACGVLAGCAAAPANPDAPSVAAEPDRAIVVGWGNTAGENVRAALTPAEGVRVSSLFVARANAQKISFGENIARLAPGQYELTVACGLYISLSLYTSETVVPATLNANRVYRLRAEPAGRRCRPFLEEVTAEGR